MNTYHIKKGSTEDSKRAPIFKELNSCNGYFHISCKMGYLVRRVVRKAYTLCK